MMISVSLLNCGATEISAKDILVATLERDALGANCRARAHRIICGSDMNTWAPRECLGFEFRVVVGESVRQRSRG